MLGNGNSEALTGTLYLKRAYRRNFIVAETSIVIAIGFALAIAALLWNGKAEVTTIEKITYNGPPPVQPPPPIDTDEPIVTHGSPPPLPDLTLVEAVDDSTVEFEFTLASREDRAAYNSDFVAGDGIGATYTDFVDELEARAPAPDSFIAVDEQPKALHFPAVRYPEIARQTNIEGSVWLKVLINTEGNVIDVIVAIPSKANVGFEEAAVAAARDSKWRPAMQNKQPITVWVGYEVRFRLK